MNFSKNQRVNNPVSFNGSVVDKEYVLFAWSLEVKYKL